MVGAGERVNVCAGSAGGDVALASHSVSVYDSGRSFVVCGPSGRRRPVGCGRFEVPTMTSSASFRVDVGTGLEPGSLAACFRQF